MRRGVAWIRIAVLVGCVMCALPASVGNVSAQSASTAVPLPRPAPLPKEDVELVQPNPSRDVTAQQGNPLFPARTATAYDPAQRASLERINAYFNSVSTLVGNFVQVGPDGSRSEGKFYMQKPGKVRFEYNPPSPIELIANGVDVAVRDRKLATQDVYPLSQTPLRFLLAEKVDLLKDANVVGVFQDELFASVIIEEKHPVAGTHRLMIMFGAKDFQLKQWTVTDQQGYDTTVAVYNLDSSQKPDPGMFKINYERMLQ